MFDDFDYHEADNFEKNDFICDWKSYFRKEIFNLCTFNNSYVQKLQ